MSKFFVMAFMLLKFPKEIDKTLIIFIIISITGFSIRLYNLAQNPLDFDESIHAYISFLLFKYDIYTYEPTTHGPFLYYITAAIFHVLGDKILSARLMPAIFGGAMVLLFLPLRRHLGNIKFLLISCMIAFSYSFITYSRLLRHDIFLAFFILAFIVYIILFFERHSIKYLYLGFAFLAITMAIKPTIYIFIFIMVYFVILNKNILYKMFEILKRQKIKLYYIIISAAFIFIAINYLFYNSMTDGFYKAFSSWITIYASDPNRKESLFPPFYFYISHLLKFEFLVFVTGFIGGLYYIFSKNKNYFILFCSFWALTSLLIFSMMSYKTPELTLNILLPFIIISGFFLGDIIERMFFKNRMIFILIIILLLIFSVFINYPLSYNTNNEYEEISQFIKTIKGDQNEIYFLSYLGNFYTIQWPLPWYLREYNLLQSDNKSNAIELNYLFDPKYSDNAKDFVHPFRTRGIIIASAYITSMEKFGYKNIKHFEGSGIYIYY